MTEAPKTPPGQTENPLTPASGDPPAASNSATPNAQTSTPPAPAPADSFIKTEAPAATPAKAERPEWFPEDLWDAEKGAKAEELNALLGEAKALRESKAALPKTAAEYLPTLPESVKLPDGASIDINDPRFVEAQKVAHAEGWSQAQFSKLMGLELQRAMGQQKVLTDAIVARDAALGPNGTARVDTLHSQIDSVFDAATAADMKRMLVTNKNIEGMEKLFSALGSQGVETLQRAPKEGGEAGKIPGYESMSMREKLAYIEARKQRA